MAKQLQVLSQDEDRLSPKALADEAMEKSGGDVQKAAQLLEKWARTRKGALEALIPERLVKQACWDCVRSYCHQERRQIWTAPNHTDKQNGSRVKEHALSLMDMRLPIPGMPRLRDATPADLDAAINHYRKQAASELERASFLEKVRAKVKTTVGADLTDSDLERLR